MAILSFSLQQWAEVLATATAIILLTLFPYTVVALKIYERDPKMVTARAGRTDDGSHHPEQPSLAIASALTVINVAAMSILVVTYFVRLIAQVETSSLTPQPAWGYALSMVNYMVVIVILWAPAVILMRVKSRIVGKALIKFPRRWW